MDSERHPEQFLLSFSSQTFTPELCVWGLGAGGQFWESGGLLGCGDSWKRKDANSQNDPGQKVSSFDRLGDTAAAWHCCLHGVNRKDTGGICAPQVITLHQTRVREPEPPINDSTPTLQLASGTAPVGSRKWTETPNLIFFQAKQLCREDSGIGGGRGGRRLQEEPE